MKSFAASANKLFNGLRDRGVSEQIDAWLGRTEVRALLLVLLAGLYLQAYSAHPALPGNATAQGWWDWFDQPRYWLSSSALSHFSITSDDYWYPLGYPLIGAPLIRLLPNHPFLIPNLLFSLGIGSLFFATCQIFLRRWEALLVTALFIVLLKRDLTFSLIPPWNTIPTHFLSYLLIFLYLKRRGDGRLVLLLSALTALVFLCRPLDAIVLAPILVAATLSLRGLREKLLFGAGGIGLLLLVYLATRLINLRVFGTWNSTYERGSAFYGLFSYDISHKFYSIFVDGLPIYHTTDPMLLGLQPWLLLILPGVTYVILENRKTLPVVCSLFLSLIVYVNYNDLGSRVLYGTGLIHYFTWAFPLLGLFSYLAIRRAWQVLPWPMYLALILGPMLCVGSIRLDVVDQQPACITSEGNVVINRPSKQAGESGEAEFEVAVFQLRSPEQFIGSSVDGVPHRHIRDYRQSWRSDEGTVAIHFAEPFDPSREETRFFAPQGTAAIFYSLDWQLAWGQSRLWAGIGRRFGYRASPSRPSSGRGGASLLDFDECVPISVPEPTAQLRGLSTVLALAFLAWWQRRKANEWRAHC